MTGEAAHCRQHYRLALPHAQRDKLPNWPDRHSAREAYKKRHTHNHFKTRKLPRDPPPVEVK